MTQEQVDPINEPEETTSAELVVEPAEAAARPAAVGERPPRPRRPGQFRRHRRRCMFCVDRVSSIDYKDVNALRHYLSDRARIEPRRKLSTCAKHQRMLATALKRARHLALLPYTPEHIRVSGFTTWRG